MHIYRRSVLRQNSEAIENIRRTINVASKCFFVLRQPSILSHGLVESHSLEKTTTSNTILFFSVSFFPVAFILSVYRFHSHAMLHKYSKHNNICMLLLLLLLLAFPFRLKNKMNKKHTEAERNNNNTDSTYTQT